MKEYQFAKSYDFLWLSLALLPLIVIACLLPLSPHDYWWYLRLGQDILREGSVPLTDAYSFTHAGDPIIYKPWLSSVIFWLVYSRGGIPFTFALRVLMVVPTYGLLWVLTRKLGIGPRLATLLILASGLATSNNWSFRPQLLVYPLFVAGLFAFWNWHLGSRRYLWILPILAILWANLHGSFPLFFILGGLALTLGRGDRKMLALALGLSVFITFINPYGPSLWRLVTTATLAGANIGPEWSPPVNEGWQMNLFFGWIILLAPLAALSPRRLSKLEWVWFLSLTWLALSGLRYVIWDVLFLAALTAALLSEWDRRWLDLPVRAGRPALNVGIALALFILSLGFLPGMRERWWTAAPPSLSPETPVAATAWLVEHPELPGPMWSDFVFSSYLIYALPSRPVWMDTRLEIIYTADDFVRYRQIASASPGWDETLARDHINLVMASVEGEPILIRILRASSEWCEQYHDAEAVIFSRKELTPCP